MVTCKWTLAVLIALQKRGFTGKDIAASKIACKSTIYWIIKNFNVRGCCEQGFRAPKKVQQGPWPSPKVDSGCRIRAPPVQSLLRNGSRQVWVHLHAQWDKDFWRMAWCQKKGSVEATSPKEKLEGQDWYSAKGTGIGLRRTRVRSFSLMNPLSNCLEHPEIIQHDGAPCHKAKVITKRLREHNIEILGPWSENSQDLIYWEFVVKQKNTNSDKLQALIMQEWAAISQVVAQKHARVNCRGLEKEGSTLQILTL